MQRRHFPVLTLFVSLACHTCRIFANAPEHLRSFMERALDMKRRAVAEGDQPYGAVVMKDGQIVAESPSRVITKKRRCPMSNARPCAWPPWHSGPTTWRVAC